MSEDVEKVLVDQLFGLYIHGNINMCDEKFTHGHIRNLSCDNMSLNLS